MIPRTTFSVAAATPWLFIAAALLGSAVAGWSRPRPVDEPGLRYTSVVQLRSRAVQRAHHETLVRAGRVRAAQLRAQGELLGDAESHLSRIRAELDPRCVWEHTGVDGQLTTTELPFPCERPVRSAGRRVVTTAYYSPEPDQTRYATGTREGDVELNGPGERTADGTAPRPGVVAAPRSYAFGTLLHLDGYGLGTVHDRGGRIVTTDGVDRVDVWMGRGDEGLHRALVWGVRDQVATVFVDGEADDIERIVDSLVEG